MKRWLLAIVLLMSWQQAKAYTLEISAEELQAKVTAMMPIEKKKFFVTVTLSNPDIDLAVGDNKMGLFSDIKLKTPAGVNGSGSIKITGALKYVADEGAFYFQSPQIISLESKDISANMLPKVRELAQLAVQEFLSRKPVYQLKDDDLKQKLAKAVLQSVKVENNKLIVELGVF
ncbi:DUF1439 domain-containing protein [Paraglaciecola sp.]|uniref:DUF1439 domain-containing protein n=1 Tax=Paraglaciecola sp. TaxID=1920173 RepID=UPI0030F47A23